MNFRFQRLLTTITASALCAGCFCKAETKDPRVIQKERSIAAFASLQKELGGTLKKAVKTEGFAAAITKCQTLSPQLEADQRTATVHIRRISDRFRNPDHAPDPWEASILAQWKSDLASGHKPGVLSAETDAGFRVMKPIIISGGLCLQCHGTPAEMNPEAAREIDRLYPEDLAKNYKPGELRGAFSAVWKE